MPTNSARVVNTLVYPIKGLAGVEVKNRGLQTSAILGVLGDRMRAVVRKNNFPITGYKPKGIFYVAMNTEHVLADHHGLEEHELDDSYQISDQQFQKIVSRNPMILDEKQTLVTSDGTFNLQDRPHPYVSFLNLASVRDLAKHLDTPIDPHRFRMNVWVEGLEPWEELRYVATRKEPSNYPSTVGPVRLGIADLCVRCKAVNQNPNTGKFDQELMKQTEAYVRDILGYTGQASDGQLSVMGWLSIPENEGMIHIGNPFSFG